MNEKNIQEFKEELANVLVISTTELEEQKNLDALSTWDSLAVVSTIAMLCQYFDAEVSGIDVEKCETFNDLLKLAAITGN